jgi:hypothetical protein
MSRKFLYRRLGCAVIVILSFFAVMAPRGAAQGRPQLKRPQEDSQEKPPEPKKANKVKGPRAVAVVQFNSGGKGTLIPVAILVEGKFYDASVYKADPVPMALESGTVYEVEQAGEPQGLFTINAALHSKVASSLHPWLGSGSYLPRGTEAAKTTRKAEDVPVGLENNDSDAPPRLTRGTAAKPAAAANPNATPASGTPVSTAPAGAGSSEKPAATAPPATSQPSSTSSGAGSSSQDAPKSATPPASDKAADQGAKPQAPAAAPATPGQSAQGQASPSQPSPSPPSPSQASPGQPSSDQTPENYYRPQLRRGKPTQPAPQEDELTTKTGKPETQAGATSSSTAPIQFVPAISDAGGPDPRPYKFFFKTGEEDDRRQQMLALAADEVRAYANALARNRIPAKPPAARAAITAHKTAAKPAQPVFENIQFRAFDVWGNNQPVIVFSAEAHFPATAGAEAAPENYSITIAARTDIYGNLRKLYTGVTDKFHLDVTPRLELIDAVDADGDGRGELLFRETTDAGSGYVIYRATGDKLWKMFDSLGAE